MATADERLKAALQSAIALAEKLDLEIVVTALRPSKIFSDSATYARSRVIDAHGIVRAVRIAAQRALDTATDVERAAARPLDSLVSDCRALGEQLDAIVSLYDAQIYGVGSKDDPRQVTRSLRRTG